TTCPTPVTRFPDRPEPRAAKRSHATIGQMRKLDFVFFDAGGGHRAAANALRQVMERQKRPCEIRMVNLQELLDGIDVFRKVTGLRLEDVYNAMLRKGWTLG